MTSEWYVKIGGKEYGPLSSVQLKQLAEQGQIDQNNQVRRGKDGQWVSSIRVSGLFKTLPSSEIKPSVLPAQPPPILTSQKNANAIPPKSTASVSLERSDLKKKLRLIPSWFSKNHSYAGIPLYIWSLIGVFALFMFGIMCFELFPRHIEKIKNPPVVLQPKVLSTEEVVALTESSVAFIQGKIFSGTGFLIWPQIVVTNKHVISFELINNIKVFFPSAKINERGPYSAILLYEDETRDLAFLLIQTNLPPLNTATQYSFRRGQEVIVIGNPGVKGEITLQNAISRGVMSTETILNGQKYYQLGISINSGNSGGPVIDSQGQVIGVVTLKATEKEGLGFCIPLNELNDSTKKALDLSDTEINSIQLKHRSQVIFKNVSLAGALYRAGMRKYTMAMEISINKGGRANTGIEEVRQDVDLIVSVFDKEMLNDLKREVLKISTDTHIPESTRQKFADLWANCIELKSYVDEPRGNFNSYRTKFNELSDNYNRLKESLGLLLGIETSEE